MILRRALLAGAALSAALPAFAAKADTDDAALWREVQDAFDLDRTILNFNTGGCCPCPRSVMAAMARYQAWSNLAPTRQMWLDVEPGIEAVRRELGREAGVDSETVAITRNASEALQIAQLGLELKVGDEVIVCDHDYPRMRDTWDARARRDGIVVVEVGFPVEADDDEIVEAYRRAITAKTKVLHITQATHLSGKVLPAARLAALAREVGATSIVDGAHAFAHLPTTVAEVDADFYGTSLHKWLLAPVGTGLLVVRKERIAGHWPLQPASRLLDADIRKFEEIGTHPAAAHNAVAEALALHRRIGIERKHARLHALRGMWQDGVKGAPGVRLLTENDPKRSGGIGVVQIGDGDPVAQADALWKGWRIHITPIAHPRVRGLRVTPNVYHSEGDVAVLVDALRGLAAG